MTAYKPFNQMARITLISIYFLILVGGIVRSTGSGMGCPDWPKCFGQWVPPTSITQLPADYKERFKVAGKKIATFDPIKTWTEYINRLIGALIGVFCFLTFLYSIPLRKYSSWPFYLSLGNVILVGFQGWLGSVVVSTNLAHWMITIHMLMAIFIAFLLHFILFLGEGPKLARQADSDSERPMMIWVSLPLLLTLIQVVFGTQVREAVDQLKNAMGPDFHIGWPNSLGNIFLTHRSYSILVFFSFIPLFWFSFKDKQLSISLKRPLFYIAGVLGLEIICGIILAYGNLPPWAQPVHLLLGVGLLGLQFHLFLEVWALEKLLSNDGSDFKGKIPLQAGPLF